jgi:hypothetical protein
MKGNMNQAQGKNNNRKILSGKSFAYKAIFVTDGVIFLFEELNPFAGEAVKINPYNGDLFLELGANVALLTEGILNHLVEAKYFFLYASMFSAYEAKEQTIAFEIKPEILARIHGAWEATKKMRNDTK